MQEIITMNEPTALQTKVNGKMEVTSDSRVHYDMLDGLRGVVAISVVCFHIFEMINFDFTKNPMGHGSLAVDFFFCLSGFVIGYAYDPRLPRIGFKTFFRNRLIRLHPLVLLGSVLGLLCYLFEPLSNNMSQAGLGKVLLAFFYSLLMLPFATTLPGRGGALYPLNSPAWSLLMEYIANILYGLLLIRLNRRWMTIILIASAIFLAYSCYSGGLLIGGWNIYNYLIGLSRVIYSFTAGLFVYRFNLVIKNRLNFLLLSLILIGFFIFPHVNGDWLTEAGFVIIGFPFLISLSAGAQIKGRLRAAGVFLGRLSYPLYMTHISFVFPLFLTYLNVYKPSGLQLIVTVVGLVCFLVGLAWLAMRFYDDPVRAYLNKKWNRKGVRAGR